MVPQGWLGLEFNNLRAVDVDGVGNRIDNLPFVNRPRGGWKGSIGHLRLHLRDLTLRGNPIVRLDADIPDVTYDLGQAFYRARLTTRHSGIGPSVVGVGEPGLRSFLTHRYVGLLTDVTFALRPGDVELAGRLRVLGAAVPFRIQGVLLPRAGRYVDLTDPVIVVNGLPLSERNARSLLGQINPLLDIERDFGLGRYLTVQRVEVIGNTLRLTGTATLPDAGPE